MGFIVVVDRLLGRQARAPRESSHGAGQGCRDGHGEQGLVIADTYLPAPPMRVHRAGLRPAASGRPVDEDEPDTYDTGGGFSIGACKTM